MEITARGLWSLIHGMGFGVLYLLACSGALMELLRFTSASTPATLTRGQEQFLKGYLVVMAVLAWGAVLTGAYVIYPWYRAVPPAGMGNLSGFPQRQLLANPSTAGWHAIGMEWKEHVAWIAPISITMVASVFIRYGRELRNHKQLRTAVLGFVTASFLAASVAGLFGAMIDKYAPVEGGGRIQLNGVTEK
jgi:hypothetical protein